MGHLVALLVALQTNPSTRHPETKKRQIHPDSHGLVIDISKLGSPYHHIKALLVSSLLGGGRSPQLILYFS